MNEKLEGKGIKALGLILSVVCFAAALFHIFIAWNTSISIIQQRVFHVFVMIVIYFLAQTQKAAKAGKKTAPLHMICALVAVVSCLYFLSQSTYYLLGTGKESVYRRNERYKKPHQNTYENR